jgi:hypothetical protein
MKTKHRGWSKAVKADVRRVRAMSEDEWNETVSDYLPEHTLVGRSLACDYCGELGEHNCMPALLEKFIRVPILQDAFVQLIKNNPQLLSEDSDVFE